MTEKELRDDLRNLLETNGWNVWFARRMKFVKQQDIFGIYDFVYVSGKEIRLGQFTTLSNKSSHVNKIQEYKKLYCLTHKSYLWLWDGKKRKWVVEVIHT